MENSYTVQMLILKFVIVKLLNHFEGRKNDEK